MLQEYLHPQHGFLEQTRFGRDFPTTDRASTDLLGVKILQYHCIPASKSPRTEAGTEENRLLSQIIMAQACGLMSAELINNQLSTYKM